MKAHHSGKGSTEGLYRRLTRNMGYLAGGTVAAALFNMLALAFNVRALSPEEFGLLVLLQSSALTLTGLMSFGTQQPVIKLGADAIAEDDKRRLGQIIGLGLLFDIAAACAASTAAFLTIFIAGDLLGILAWHRSLACIFAAALLFTGYLTSNGIFRLLNRFGLLSLLQAGTAAALLASSALLYVVEASLAAYVWAWAIFMALGAQLQLWTALYLITKQSVKVRISYRAMSPADVKDFFAYCWTTWGTSSTETLRTHGDSVLVGALVSIEAVGLYNVAKQVAGILRKLTTIYASAAFPEVSMLAARKDVAGATRLRRRMILVGAGIGGCGVLTVLLIGRPLLNLAFGAYFVSAYGALVLLVAAAALQLVSHTQAIYVQVFVGPAKLFGMYLASTLLFAVFAPLLIWVSAIEGAALAQILFILTLVAFSQILLRRSASPMAHD